MYEYRVTFAHPNFGFLTGFVNLDSPEAPVRGKVFVYVPSLHIQVETSWEKATSSMIVGGIA